MDRLKAWLTDPPNLNEERNDALSWKGHSSKVFTVNSAYKVSEVGVGINFNHVHVVRKNVAPTKIQVFAYSHGWEGLKQQSS